MPRCALHLVFDWLDLHNDELMENWKRMEICKYVRKRRKVRANRERDGM